MPATSVRLLSAMRVVEESMPNQPPVFKDGRIIPLQPAPWPVGIPQPVVPPGTPPDVQVVWEAPEPLLAEEADLGVHVDVAWDGDAPEHTFVTVGDSLTQGFKSLAITDTNLSWPAIVAWELGLSAQQFTFPRYPGPAGCPGLPLNLEAVARGVDRATGGTGVVGEHPIRELIAVAGMLHQVKSYWEHGPGSAIPDPVDSFHHNLAIYGWDLRDAFERTVAEAIAVLTAEGPWLHLPSPTVSHDGERATLLALQGPEAGDTTMVSAANWLGDHGGIDTLVVALGSNNALRSAVQLNLVWSTGPGSSYTVATPTDFATDLAELADRIAQIRARRVIWATVPHVTIAPIARGIGDKPTGSRYFTRYTHAWISDNEFNTAVNPFLTGEQARVIDSAIDQYNYAIKQMVYDARTSQDGAGQKDWLILDLCGLLDRLAYRRYVASADSQPSWWQAKAYELPPALKTLTPRPDTRIYRSDAAGRIQGGLIALDGVHPTTIGYGILAQEVARIMQHAGVPLPDQQGKPRPNPIDIDFPRLVQLDTLIAQPPKSIGGDLGALGFANEAIDIVLTLLDRRAI
jgi:hypothetical protein